MQHQSITEAMTTQDLVFSLENSNSDDEGKMNWQDCLAMLAQVASAVGFCWIVNFVAA